MTDEKGPWLPVDVDDIDTSIREFMPEFAGRLPATGYVATGLSTAPVRTLLRPCLGSAWRRSADGSYRWLMNRQGLPQGPGRLRCLAW